jgi:hypothetical protein
MLRGTVHTPPPLDDDHHQLEKSSEGDQGVHGTHVLIPFRQVGINGSKGVRDGVNSRADDKKQMVQHDPHLLSVKMLSSQSCSRSFSIYSSLVIAAVRHSLTCKRGKK